MKNQSVHNTNCLIGKTAQTRKFTPLGSIQNKIECCLKTPVLIFIFLMASLFMFTNCGQESKVSLSCPGETVLNGVCDCTIPDQIISQPRVSAAEIKPEHIVLPYYRPLTFDRNKPYKNRTLSISSAQFGGQRKALRSYRAVGRVGGVWFEQIATPESSLANKKVSIAYNASNNDGCRLIIEIGGQKYIDFIPDWVLIPTALYANSENTAIVSLFGENSTDQVHEIVYHEALLDELLGLRLLQADILLLGEKPTSLFENNGELILGFGEKAPVGNFDANSYIAEINRKREEQEVQSWVMTDLDTEVVFSVDRDNQRFNISGYPYYYFWKSEISEELLENLSEADQEKFLTSYLSVLFETDYEPDQEFRNMLEKIMEVEPISHLIEDYRTTNRHQIRSLNPVVYDATTQMMRYAAFFRYIKETNNKSWNRFIASIENLNTQPQLFTPTSLDRYNRQ